MSAAAAQSCSLCASWSVAVAVPALAAAAGSAEQQPGCCAAAAEAAGQPALAQLLDQLLAVTPYESSKLLHDVSETRAVTTLAYEVEFHEASFSYTSTCLQYFLEVSVNSEHLLIHLV